MKSKTRIGDNIPQSRQIIYDVKINLTKNKNKTWNGKWTIGKATTNDIIGTSKQDSSMEELLENIAKDFKYEFLLDEQGSFLELINWKEIQELSSKVLENMIAKLQEKDKNLSQTSIENIQKNAGVLFSNKENIEKFLIQDVKLFFDLQGTGFKKNKNFNQKIQTQNPFTNDPVEQDVKIGYKEAYSDGTFNVNVSQKIDKQSLMFSLENTMKKMSENSNKTKIEDFKKKLLNFGVEVSNTYIISSKTGFVESILSEKNTLMNNTNLTNKIVILAK